MNRRVVLASRPSGEPTPDNFRLETGPVPEPGPGQMLEEPVPLDRPVHAGQDERS
jgi:NADPH-dependent curcumin reductase